METLMVRAVKRPDEKIEDEVQLDVMGYLLQRRGRWVPLKTVRSLFGRSVDRIVRFFELKGWVELRYFMRQPSKEGSEVERFLKHVPDVKLPETPTDEQRAVIQRVTERMEAGEGGTFLLHGVTGSGKTFVYLQLARKAWEMGRSAIILVPEIGLTPQIAAQFIAAFGPEVGIYHSKFTGAERRWIWRNVYDGRIRIVIGPRSALFLPFRNPGLIVVDEEHDSSYKQSETPPLYNARDVAVMRGHMENAVVVLGSATPSAESYFNAMRGKFVYLPMKKRILGYTMPEVLVVDMRETPHTSPLSVRLLEELQKAIKGGRQAILFLNRRGFAPYIQCLDCGYVFKCPHCSVTLTYHRREKKMKCHLCGYETPPPDTCPKCGSTRLKPSGSGTEKVEDEIRKVLPDVRILRMDLDTTRRKHAHEEIYEKFRRKEADILIGTQMIVKGFDFPDVGVVGVVLADIGLNMPDFRAEERTFQLLTQVIGRARRGGRVVIQTYSPDSPAIAHAVKMDYRGFMVGELRNRKEFGYPPFRRLISIILSGKSEKKVQEIAQALYERLTAVESDELEIYPPNPAPIQKMRGKYRYRIVIKSKRPYLAQEIISKIELKQYRSVHIIFDVDPIDML